MTWLQAETQDFEQISFDQVSPTFGLIHTFALPGNGVWFVPVTALSSDDFVLLVISLDIRKLLFLCKYSVPSSVLIQVVNFSALLHCHLCVYLQEFFSLNDLFLHIFSLFDKLKNCSSGCYNHFILDCSSEHIFF